jgi:hypothetical protein
MMAGLYHGIQRAKKDRPPPTVPRHSRPAASKWATLDDMKLMLDIRSCQQTYGVSKREAVSLIAEAFPPDTRIYPYKPQAASRTSAEARARYEGGAVAPVAGNQQAAEGNGSREGRTGLRRPLCRARRLG